MTTDFSQGRVSARILAQAVPLTLAQLVQLLYSIVDRIYIGHLPGLGSAALTGVGLTFPVVTLIAAFTALFSMGGTPLFSIARGAGEEERACAALMDAVLLRLAEEKRLDVLAALLSGDQKTFEALRCEAPELLHVPAATFEWYETHYLDRDYPIRLIMRLNGVQFPE